LKDYSTGNIRNVVLVSHSGAGKTSLLENALFATGAITRIGKVEDGSTTSDFEPEEIKRKVSINATLIPIEWQDFKINFIDTPGYFDFVGEEYSAMAVADSAILVVDAVGGVEVGTEKNWSLLCAKEKPRMVVVNRLDRENADFYRTLESLRDKFGVSVIPVQIPIGAEGNLQGVIDLVDLKAVYYSKNDPKNFELKDIPDEYAEQVDIYRDMMLESLSETEDELMMKYLDGQSLSDAEIHVALKKGTAAGLVFPVYCASAGFGFGIPQLLNAVIQNMPAPDANEFADAFSVDEQPIKQSISSTEAFSALVFKSITDPFVGKLTLFKVMSGILKPDSHIFNSVKGESERIAKIFYPLGKTQIPANQVVAGDIAAVAKLQYTATGDTLCDKEHQIIFPALKFPQPMFCVAAVGKTSGDEDKIASGLSKLAEEDPTFRIEKNAETKQLLIYGIGDLQLDVIKDRLKRKFGAEMDTEVAKIPYRETIKTPVKVEGKHKKQSGGHGQFGHVWVEFLPLEPGKGFEFSESIFGGSVPKQYIPAVEKGLLDSLDSGVLAGYPVVDFKANLYDGSYHPVDSSEMAFKIAAHLAFKKGMETAHPVLLEPIMHVEVTVPDAFMGDVIGDFNSKRGRILGMEPTENSHQVVKAHAPLAELATYALDLRSLTQGRGSFTMDFFSYEEVPERTKHEVIEAAKKAKAEE